MIEILDQPAFTSQKARKRFHVLMFWISMPMLLFSGFMAWKATAEHERAIEALGALQVLTQKSMSPIIALDQHGIILTWTKNAENIFGYTAEEAIGQTPQFLMPKSMRERHLAAYSKAISKPLEEARTLRVHCHGLTKDNKRVELFITARVMPHEKFGKIAVAIIDRERDIVNIEALDPDNIHRF